MSTTALYAAPTTPPPPPAAPSLWHGLRPTWTGWDGSTWELSNPASGVLLMRGGTRGLSMPPFRRFTSSAAAVHGSRWRGRSTDEREVFLPLCVWSNEGSQAWVDLERALWRTMHPDLPGVLSLTHPDGQVRSLTCRFVDDGAHAFDMLPARFGWATYGVRLVAEDPFWRGTPVMQSWRASTAVPFFGGVGAPGGPPFVISSGRTFDLARVTNPGDEPSHAVWLVHGPTTSAHVGVSGKQVIIPWELDEGRTVVVDTSPTSQTAFEVDTPSWATAAEPTLSATAALAWARETGPTGTNRTRELGASTKFQAIPAGAAVTLAIEVVGSGSVTALVEPLYWRAW